ncbi:MAG: LruC domain-containing protein [Bacteroidales bacterium]|nr:LruC domain-containing protein [Bacteroidales bacterium]
MKTKTILSTFILLLAVSGSLFATTRYVSLSGSNTAPYTSLATAANTFQTAIGASTAGDLILVDDGTYILSSKISLTIGVTIRSINGSSAAIVDGNNATKCFEINHADALVDGFTIKNGKNLSGFGGGVNITYAGTVQNCFITNNQARDGGGIALDYGGLAQNCIVTNNTSQYGGGIRCLNSGTTVRNCLVLNNTTTNLGGGINTWNGGDIYNCTIAHNTSPVGNGAGIRTRGAGHVYNSIIYENYNTSGILENWDVDGSTHSYTNVCTVPLAPNGSNNITADPSFVSITPGSEDYHLQAGSPCINTGQNAGWMATVADLDGNSRIQDGVVDMGTYESAPAPVDTDGDGVADVDDDYPNDADRAFDNFEPASGYSTLGFEDLWPGMGDYDFNDLVCDYRFQTVTNASNKVVEIFGTFVIKAFGASMHNGFGFQFANDNVSQAHLDVSGYHLEAGSYISLESNGLESGQAKPTIIVFDNAFHLMQYPGSGTGVNTVKSAPYVTPETVNIYIEFTSPIYSIAQVAIAQFNPFMIADLDRDVEIHLPDYPPTTLADQTLFGTGKDDSNPLIGRYYKTANNLPWAIKITESFAYPKEEVQIVAAYNHFVEWAESNGVLFTTWYEDIDDNRNDSNIY